MSAKKVKYEVRLTTDPDGNLGVLVQFPDGYVIFTQAAQLAGFMVDIADATAEFMILADSTPPGTA